MDVDYSAEGAYRQDLTMLSSIDEYYLDTMFKLYYKDGVLFYNLGKTIDIPETLDPSLYTEIVYNSKIPLTTLSYMLYGTQHLWWLILYTNKILNPFKMPPDGSRLKILTTSTVRYILDRIQIEMQASK